MSEENADKVGAVRGPSYPFIDLQKALERVEVITSKGAERTTLAPESFYKFWNYQSKSSNARQTMAAMNAYGLVEYVGRGKERKVKLTDCARRIALDRTPNSETRIAAIRQAALEPSAFHDLWGQFGPHLPHEDVMTSWLVLEKEFNQSGADAAVANFVATVEFAGLEKPANKPESFDSQDDRADVRIESPRVGDFVEVEVGGQLQFAAPVRVRGVSPDGAWFFVEGTETGYSMEQVTVVEPPADSGRKPPTMPLEQQKPKAEVNDLKPLFDFDSVTINTKITSQWHLTELIARLEKLKPLLPPGVSESGGEN